MAPLIHDFPHMLHGGDYNADQWWANYPEVINEDFQLMPLAGCNAFSIGIFAWASLEPQEGVYDFRWLDDIMDRLAKSGFKALLATPAPANQIGSRKNIEVRRVLPNGTREPQQKRANHCPSSPIFRQKLTISPLPYRSATPIIRPWVCGISITKLGVKLRTAIAIYATQISENG